MKLAFKGREERGKGGRRSSSSFPLSLPLFPPLFSPFPYPPSNRVRSADLGGGGERDGSTRSMLAHITSPLVHTRSAEATFLTSEFYAFFFVTHLRGIGVRGAGGVCHPHRAKDVGGSAAAAAAAAAVAAVLLGGGVGGVVHREALLICRFRTE